MANQPLFNALFDETERKPLTVSELTNSIRIALESRFAAVWVEGEISNFKAHSSGHWYFTLKDQGAQLRAKCFRSANTRIRFRPTDGLHVRARGKLSLYAPRGEYELVVEALDPVGAGALRIAFEQLRDRLNAEGLFAKELKRPLPVFPRRVGIVTSPTGAAIRDILNVISRRTRTVHVLFSPARVQGDLAGPDIARAIRFINLYHERALREGRTEDLVDVLIVGRGGGSTEDLWAFNQEEVARAIRKSAIPVISAVGHETDFTIADFVADFRAPTPSAAAEIVAAREDQLCSSLDNLGRQLVRQTRYQIVNLRTRVQKHALSHAFDEVKSRLANARLRYKTASSACDAAIDAKLQQGRERLGLAAASLDALSPLGVLQRGYAIAQDDAGKLVRDAASVNPGDAVTVRLARGRLNTRVVTTDQE
ncbi:MAG TPA: exodeoxyribonuclease VII large subunit [Pyrinomonadaceae bacterium]|nr:exodeoxyribonuclease VII large subunit [Pyrinomonadaceae bacterium]